MDPVEDNFASLRRLLAFKRNERPPPGYFDRLPDRILNRIALDDAPEPGNWMHTLLERFHLRPALAGFACVAVGAACFLGINASERMVHRPLTASTDLARPWLRGGSAPVPGQHSGVISLARYGSVSSVAPVLSTRPPVSHLPTPDRFQPVHYINSPR